MRYVLRDGSLSVNDPLSAESVRATSVFAESRRTMIAPEMGRVESADTRRPRTDCAVATAVLDTRMIARAIRRLMYV